MIGRAWLRGDVPSAYARQTLRGAGTQLNTARTSLKATGDAEPLALAALESYRDLSTVLQAMADAVGHDDRRAVARMVTRLPAAERSLRSLSEEAGAGG